MELKVKKETVVFIVDSFDLEKFIQEKLDPEYDMSDVEEFGNDSYHLYDVDGVYMPHDPSRKNFYRRSSTRLGDILDILCAEGHIEAGKYLVSVCW